ncbi:D-alanyl-lipoteichoic acid acyltransferase DltB, MBOAT superfamily [Lachnospiraceae bacterium NK3A20]|nr:D-alanyl-lipoteichoic acid acyltransferase DltB, MBOAT superfamily [Lachnospiraceae bacterium NK3A20]
MQFNSLYFVILFLPAVVGGYWLLNRAGRRAADLFLLVMSFIFYAFAGWESLALLLIGILANWLIGYGLRRNKSVAAHANDPKAGQDGRAKALLVLGILFNAGTLGIFKYTNFFIENLNVILRQDLPLVQLILPLGISFLAFSQITWIVDSYRGETMDVTFSEYALYACYFPRLTQGPIMSAGEFVPQLREKRSWDWERAVRGSSMFILGLSKKVLLSDTFGKAVAWGFQYIDLTTSADMILTAIAYTFQIYFDFSGYSDMAIGVSLLCGFDIPVNFDSPYKALSITDFWRRWHMSLTSFLRKYIYFPLGGSRKGRLRTYVNIMIVFLVSGIWHGANWTFILWGVLHGALQCIERAGKGFLERIWKPVRWLATFLLVTLLWLLFRSSSLFEFRRALYHIQMDRTIDANGELLGIFSLPGLRYLLTALGIPYSDDTVFAVSTVLFYGLAFFLVLVPENTQRRKYQTSAATLALMLVLAIVCLLSMSSVSTFIYNNF